MPPINQQGSRTGLITALVVFVILFVLSAVFAFNNYGQLKQSRADYEAYQTRYNGFLTEADINSPPVVALNQAKTEMPPHFGLVNSPSMTAIQVAMHQRDGLAQAITGGEAGQAPSVTYDAAAKTLRDSTDALKAAGVTLDLATGGLDSAVARLTERVVSQQAMIKKDATDLAAANAKVQQVTASVADVNAAGAKALTDASATAAQAAQAAQQRDEAAQATLKALQDDQAASVKKNQDAAQQSANMVADIERQLKQAQATIQSTRDRMTRRPYVDDTTVRVPDGMLIRVPSDKVCYINLGYGTGVSNGLTFEVYDKLTGVPPLPPAATGDEQLPVGKASIEVIHVGQNSSECRIIHTTPGAVLTEGDVIGNLVYDAHQKYNFDVYGQFDLANTGHPNSADAEVVKRLVTQWGGKLIDHISPDTDFLVLGAEPVVPDFSKDDLTPENQAKVTAAQDALDKYQEVRQQAKDLHIPVLNQNRFLYYIGYYEQATR